MHSLETPRVPYASRLTRKGQVTVPAAIRRQLGLKQGDKVAFVQEGDAVTLKPAQSIADQTAGILAPYRRTPAPSPQEERAAFEQAVAEDVVARSGG